jgi:hypothetical protein
MISHNEKWDIKRWLYQILQHKYMHGNTQKKMDDMFFI